MARFSITSGRMLTVVEDDEDHKNSLFPQRFALIRDLPLAPYGTLPMGAVCNARPFTDGTLALEFEKLQSALRQWDNILLLFPDCVDTPILNALQALEPPVIQLWRAEASIAAVFLSFA